MSFKKTICCLPLALAIGSSPAMAVPADITTISTAADAIDKGLALTGREAEKRFLPVFTQMVLDQALAIGQDQGITEAADLDSKDFKKFVVKWVSPKVQKASSIVNPRERREEWYQLLRISSTEANAHNLLASWMDFDAPTTYLSKANRGTPPRISSQVTASSSDGRLKVYEPNIALGGELGGAGQGNGVIDAGEWVNLGLAIYNDSKLPFFSSSAWIVSGHECAWVPKAYEIELNEMPAQTAKPTTTTARSATGKLGEQMKNAQSKIGVSGSQGPQTEPLSTWVYLSNSCTDETIVPLQVKVLDTHRAPKSPVVMAVNLRVRNRGKGKVIDYLIDSDQPGWSDNSPLPEVEASREFELSHGFETSSVDLMSARAAWAIRKDLAPVFKEAKPPTEPLISSGSGRFMPGDDLDLKTHDSEDYDRAVQGVADELRWTSTEDSRAWFATDTEVLFETPDPPIEGPPPPPPPEICNNYLDDDRDGKHDCQDSDCSTAAECNLPAPVDFKTLFPVISDNASIVANPATPSIPGAIEAVEPGYELVLDRDLLAQQYQCLIDKIPLSECGKTACPDCNVVQKADAEQPVIDTGRDPSVTYHYRNYFTIPMDWNPQESEEFKNCGDDWDNDLDGYEDCDDSECNCGRKSAPAKETAKSEPIQRYPYRRVDLNLKAAVYTQNELGNQLVFPTVGLRYVWGPKDNLNPNRSNPDQYSRFRLMFAAGFMPEAISPVVGANPGTSLQMLGMGLSPHFKLLNWMEGRLFLEPHALVMLANRAYTSANGLSNQWTPTIDLGLAAHLRLKSGWGMYGGASIQSFSEDLTDDVDGDTILSTNPLGGQVGISRTF